MKLSPKKTDKPTKLACPIKVSKLAPSTKSCSIPTNTCGIDNSILQVKSYVESLTNNILVDTYILTVGSLTGGGNLESGLVLQLVNDNANPGNIQYYGTDINGVKGYYTIPLGGSIQYQDEGINLGIPFGTDTLNFTGPHITASRSGNTITVEVDTFVDAFNNPI